MGADLALPGVSGSRRLRVVHFGRSRREVGRRATGGSRVGRVSCGRARGERLKRASIRSTVSKVPDRAIRRAHGERRIERLHPVERRDVPGVRRVGRVGPGLGGPPAGAAENDRQTDRLGLCHAPVGVHHLAAGGRGHGRPLGGRWVFKTEGEGSDCLYLAGILSVVMGACCIWLLPVNELARTGEIPIVKALSALQDPNFLIFVVISMVVAGMMQFYFLGTAQFMQDIGVPGKNVPASMAIAQAAQAAATWFLLGLLLETLGFKWTLTIGAACWLGMYVVYVAPEQPWMI